MCKGQKTIADSSQKTRGKNLKSSHHVRHYDQLHVCVDKWILSISFFINLMSLLCHRFCHFSITSRCTNPYCWSLVSPVYSTSRASPSLKSSYFKFWRLQKRMEWTILRRRITEATTLPFLSTASALSPTWWWVTSWEGFAFVVSSVPASSPLPRVWVFLVACFLQGRFLKVSAQKLTKV